MNAISWISFPNTYSNQLKDKPTKEYFWSMVNGCFCYLLHEILAVVQVVECIHEKHFRLIIC